MRVAWLLLALPGLACSKSEGTALSAQRPLSKAELAPQAPAPAEIDYRRYCLGCHGDDGRGNGGTTGADLTATDSPLRTKSDDALLASVRDGKIGKVASMPAHKPVLSDDQIRALLALVHRRFDPPEAHPGDASP